MTQRVSQAAVDLEALRRDFAVAQAQWDRERVAHMEALREVKAEGERWSTIESLLSRLPPRPDAVPGAPSV